MPREPFRELERRLRDRIKGEVRFDAGARALYATDGSNYRQLPIGVVIPRDADDAFQIFSICKAVGAPILSRGGGTSLAGQCCNVAVVIDYSKYMNRILELDPHAKFARVQPGLVLDELRSEAEKHSLTFGPDPSTHSHCTLGGMIGNNSCGTHSVMAGETSANIHELDVLTYDGLRMRVGQTSEEELEQIMREGGRRGEIYSKMKELRDRYADLIRARFPKIPRRVSGYSLDELLPEKGFHVARALVGTEGTCVSVLEAKVRLVESPRARSLLVLGYPDVYAAGDHVPEIMKYGPIALEGLDDNLVQDMIKKKVHPERARLLPEGKGWLLVEFGASTREESDAKAKRVMSDLRGRSDAPSMKLFDDPGQERIIWKVRESGLGATARVPGENDTWEGWEDSSVSPHRLGDYLRNLRKLFQEYGYACALYGHFGQGCVHTRIDFDLKTSSGIAKFRAFLHDAAELVTRHGGSLSGEHGDGQSKAEFLPVMYGAELVRAFQEFKAIWDPYGKMNPGKVVHPYKIDQNLRLGTHYDPSQPPTHFRFPEDDGSLSRATLRCVGIGDCRRITQAGTMCPSYKVTREEKDSTRGRARLLFEMLRGQPLSGGWREKAVKDALDLCLACKGCKSDCPMGVDMATYKAEFLSHYYKRRLRPLSAYAMGLIYWWARAIHAVPGLSWLFNWVIAVPVVGDAIKRLGGISPRRQLPRFSGWTFEHWWGRRSPRNQGSPKVLLWADTFNNHFFPETAKAAVHVLESAGFQVVVPHQSLCCGRPLYDYGMLNAASRLLSRILRNLKPYIERGIPLVALEPSCLAVFRDELINLFPNQENAKRLHANSFLLGEFLEKYARDFTIPMLRKKALIQGHCHQKSVIGMTSDMAVLKRLGLECDFVDAGCCGMAGSFGFEASHYEVSMAVGEYALMPMIRKASPETMIIANGFSCREQIKHATGREALHLAQVLEMALRQSARLEIPEGTHEADRLQSTGEG